jgi:hypothetical protein
MTKGWVTFATQKYADLLNVLIDSLLEFSKYPIEVFSSGYDLKSGGNVVSKRFDVPDNFTDICYAKNLLLPIKTESDVCAVIDCDMIANKNCDDVLDFTEEIGSHEYPICSAHGQDPNNQAPTMARLGVEYKSMPYVYSTYLSCNSARPFFEDSFALVKQWRYQDFVPANTGETMINCMLWKRGVKEQTNCWIPHVDVLPHYLQGTMDRHPLVGYYEGKALSYQFWHGEKNADKARKNFEKLKASNSDLLMVKPRLLKY